MKKLLGGILIVAAVFGLVIVLAAWANSANGQQPVPAAPQPALAPAVTADVATAGSPKPIVTQPPPPAPQASVVWTGNFFYLTNERPIVDAVIVDNRVITNRVYTNIVAMPFEIGIHSSGVLVWRQK